MQATQRARNDQPALSSRHCKRAFLEGERGALLALLRLFLLLYVACAQLHRVLPRRRPGHLFKLNLAAPVGGIMRAALPRKRPQTGRASWRERVCPYV